jgi:hypothetical protein
VKKFVLFVPTLILVILSGGCESYQHLPFSCMIDGDNDHIMFQVDRLGQSLGINGSGRTEDHMWGYATERKGEWVLTTHLPLNPLGGIIEVRLTKLTPYCLEQIKNLTK